MSATAARLFAWLQDAAFYREMHLDAANLLPAGEGRSWLDVGCGPGVLTRLAAERGYAARGIDRDPEMIEAAVRLAAERVSPAKFAVADIEAAIEGEARYDVVSASSLLVVVPDPAAALRRLVSLAKPDGLVLVIEASRELTRARAFAAALSRGFAHRAYMLQVWATFRAGRTLPRSTFDQPGLAASRRPVLGGLADAWTVARAP
jgi:2-polyprenyl-3-methyl-5-hydroxy-6-metoxy-1,4-benzoquinol methylase